MDEDNGLTEKKFFLMLKIHNFFQSPENKKKRFKSLNHIGQCFDGYTVVSPLTRQVLKMMLDNHLITVTDENSLGLDISAFEEFVERSAWGSLMFGYVDEKSTIRIG
jgi:hypothetical protein